MSSSGASISAEHFRQILDVTRMLAVTTDLDTLLMRIAEAATALLDCERASIFLHDPKTDELCTKIALLSREIRVPSNAGIVGTVFKSNAVLHVPRPYDDPRFNKEPDRKSGFVTRNLLTAPMVDLSRNAIGVIQAVNNRSNEGFAPAHGAMIQLLADQAGVAIQRYRLQAAAEAARDLQREMNLARQVQQALIPKQSPQIPGLTAVGWTKAASDTGGDCFDLWRTGDGRLGVLVADATGHGLAPALVVSQTRTLVRGVCDMQPDPFDLLRCANSRLAEDLRPGTFVTAFLAFISPDGLMHWSSAGHGPIFMRESRDADLIELQPPAVPLGVVSEFNGDRVDPIQLKPGGLLAAISDGVLEARSPANDILDPPRVIDTLNRLRTDGPKAMLDALRRQLIDWQGKEEPIDDQTVVLVERT